MEQLILTIPNRLRICWEVLTAKSGHKHKAGEKMLSTFLRGYTAGMKDGKASHFSSVSGQWVSVKDRLPEKNQLCFVIYRVTAKHRWYGVSTFRKDKFDCGDVTHWMTPIEKPIDA